MKNYSSSFRRNIGHWWILLALGILLTGLGIYAILFPSQAYMILAWLFGFSFIVTGVMSITMSLIGKRIIPGWGWYLAWGILGVLLGIYLLANIIATEMVMYLILAFWLLVEGIFLVAQSVSISRLRNSGWGWTFVGGILTIIISFIIMFNPFIGYLTIIMWLAIGLILSGISAIGLAIRAKRTFID